MSMKLAFIGGKYPDTLEDTARLAADVGYEALEFDYWNEFEELITDDVVSWAQGVLQRHGVGVAAYGLWGYNHLSPDADERAHAHETLDRAIGCAEQLGAHALVLGTGDMPDEPVERKLDEFATVFRPILKRIADAGMQPAFYAIHGGSFLDSVETFDLACERLPGVKLKYDPANWGDAGQDYVEVARRCRDRMGHVHIKEVIHSEGRIVSQPPAGMGEIEWGKVLTFLYEGGYDGHLSVEPHMPPWTKGEALRTNLILSKRHISRFLL